MTPVECRISGVFLHVADMACAVAFYSQLLGREISDRYDNGNIFVVPTEGGSVLILDANKPDQHQPSDKPVFMFPTPDIDAALAHVKSLGIDLAWPKEDHGAVAFFTFRDPDGNMLMVCQSGR